MKSILKDIYNGEIISYERIVCKEPEYHELYRKISNEREYLTSKLCKEDSARLEDMLDMQSECGSMYNAEAFAEGFKLGVLVMVETFAT